MKRLITKRLLLKLLLILSSTIIVLSTIFVVSAVIIGYKVTNPTIKAIDRYPSDYGLEYEDLSFKSMKDNVNLKGWWIPTKNTPFLQNERAVIFAHGYGFNRTFMPFDNLELAKRLNQEGYHVLMFDFRNSGLSDESMTTLGLNEKIDLLSAIKYATEQKNIKEVALMGWSMGAATSILVGIESEAVKAVIADSPFSDLNSYSLDSFQYWTGLPRFLAKGMIKINQYVYPEFKINDVKPIVAAQDYPVGKGLFLIHSKKDGAIPYSQSMLIHEKSVNSILWLSPKGGHIRSYNYFKDEYEQRVLEFLDNHFQKNRIVDRLYYTL
jgi:uncharacterized protein